MRYRCRRGHIINAGPKGTFTALVVQDHIGEHNYNYCMRCFGEDMQKAYPVVAYEPIEEAAS